MDEDQQEFFNHAYLPAAYKPSCYSPDKTASSKSFEFDIRSANAALYRSRHDQRLDIWTGLPITSDERTDQ